MFRLLSKSPPKRRICKLSPGQKVFAAIVPITPSKHIQWQVHNLSCSWTDTFLAMRTCRSKKPTTTKIDTLSIVDTIIARRTVTIQIVQERNGRAVGIVIIISKQPSFIQPDNLLWTAIHILSKVSGRGVPRRIIGRRTAIRIKAADRGQRCQTSRRHLRWSIS